MRIPDFTNLELVLQKKKTPKPVLFEFILGDHIKRLLVGEDYKVDTEEEALLTSIKAFERAGYDYTPVLIRGMKFPRMEHLDSVSSTKSLNAGTIIEDEESFRRYRWPETEHCDFDLLKRCGKHLPGKMKFIPYSYDGILENAIGILGYENLCYMLYDDEELLEKVFYQIGLKTYEYYMRCLDYEEVGAVMLNDDWGFNTQTMLPPDALRKYVFPWYKLITREAHQRKKYSILHSCGYYGDILNDIIEDMKVDGRHSYEDNIVPVESAYLEMKGRIAVLGGIDVDFLVRSTPEEIRVRAKNLISLTKEEGGYALGSGNSIPDFVPFDHYWAMIQAVLEDE